MSFELMKVSKGVAHVRIGVDGRPPRDWTVKLNDYGSLGAVRASASNGDTCTIGMFRTRDGSQMAPDYARLRKALTAVMPRETRG